MERCAEPMVRERRGRSADLKRVQRRCAGRPGCACGPSPASAPHASHSWAGAALVARAARQRGDAARLIERHARAAPAEATAEPVSRAFGCRVCGAAPSPARLLRRLARRALASVARCARPRRHWHVRIEDLDARAACPGAEAILDGSPRTGRAGRPGRYQRQHGGAARRAATPGGLISRHARSHSALALARAASAATRRRAVYRDLPPPAGRQASALAPRARARDAAAAPPGSPGDRRLGAQRGRRRRGRRLRAQRRRHLAYQLAVGRRAARASPMSSAARAWPTARRQILLQPARPGDAALPARAAGAHRGGAKLSKQTGAPALARGARSRRCATPPACSAGARAHGGCARGRNRAGWRPPSRGGRDRSAWAAGGAAPHLASPRRLAMRPPPRAPVRRHDRRQQRARPGPQGLSPLRRLAHRQRGAGAPSSFEQDRNDPFEFGSAAGY